jgi:hypothetical protein
MRTSITLILGTLLFIQVAFAGGSISWEDVKPRIAKSDPELVKINYEFTGRFKFTQKPEMKTGKLCPMFIRHDGFLEA